MIIIFESNPRFFHETSFIHLLCDTHSTHNTCMHIIVYGYTMEREQFATGVGGEAAIFNRRSLVPIIPSIEQQRIVCSSRFSELVSSTDMKTKTGLRVTITTGINIKIVLKLCNIGSSMVKREMRVYGEDNWSFNLLEIIWIENNGSFTPLLGIVFPHGKFGILCWKKKKF